MSKTRGMSRLRWHQVPVFIFSSSSEITASFSNPQKNPRRLAAIASDKEQERRFQLEMPRLTIAQASRETLAFWGDLRAIRGGELTVPRGPERRERATRGAGSSRSHKPAD